MVSNKKLCTYMGIGILIGYWFNISGISESMYLFGITWIWMGLLKD